MSFEEGVAKIVANIDYWRNAPLWDPESIAKATRTWFEYLAAARDGDMDAASKQLFSHKIKTAEELRDVIGPRPRKKKVIMCHGTFDVVHPGHVRHLLYAKTKADILIASLTADAHIKKGNFRPVRAGGPARDQPRRARDGRLRGHRPRPDAAQKPRAHPAGLFRQGLRVHGGPGPSQDAGGDRGPRVLRRRDHLHAGRHRLFVLGADRARAARTSRSRS